MLFTYLKITLRNLLRYKSFSLINLAGLTIGLTAFLGISLFVVDELSFDQHHEHQDRIYRAVISAEFDGKVTKWGGAPNLLAPTAMKEIPEVEKSTRYFHHNFGSLSFVNTENENFAETNLFYVDPEFFEIFSVDILKGIPGKSLDRPGTVLLSERAAKKYFGDSDPIGKTLTVDNSLSLEVTGVYRNFPYNSFLQAELMASFSSHWFGQERNQSWGNASFDTFFLLHQGVQAQQANEKMEAMLARNIAADNRWFTIALQPLTDIRLHSADLNADFDRRDYGDLRQVKILIALSIVILVIAAINYMNLTTAQSQRRNKEIGIAKTLGATFRELNRKFYTEAGLFVLLALLMSIALFTLALPAYNALSGKQITSAFLSEPVFWLGFALLWLVLTVISGAYPAWYLASFSPKYALQATSRAAGQASSRKGLVVFQFAISMVLMICAVVFYQQMQFIQDKKLGYNPEQVVAVMTSAAKDSEQVLTVKSAYESLTDVISVARVQAFPGMNTSMRNIVREGDQGDGAPLLTSRASHEVLNVLDIKLLAGRTLPETKVPSDTTIQVLVNKATVDYLGLTPEEAIGKRVNIQGFDGPTEVVGVMEDFHTTSLHQKIGAYCFHNANRTEPFSYLLVKVNTGNLPATVKQLENTYKKNIAASFEFTFLDQHLAGLYQSERNLQRIVILFAGLAIVVACLGLYALAAYTAEQRTKEIGIRKVMGASVNQLIGLLSQDFVRLVLIAIVLGIPIGYYLMTEWLNTFAYRIDLHATLFVIAGLISLLIALITVSFESFRAARANPVKSLRSE